MPQDIKTIIRAGYDYFKLTWPGPVVSTVVAAANLTQAAYDSGYIQLVNVPRIPLNGIFVAVNIPGPISSTGAAGSSTLTLTLTESSDGVSASGASHTYGPINVTYAASVGTVTNLNPQGVALGTGGSVAFFRLPETRKGWIRIQGATVLTTVTACDYGKVTIAFQDEVDTEATNATDLG